jgi:hypothetical protein
MGYKILGFAVWQGGKWYLRRRFRGAPQKVAIAGLAGVLIAGVLIAGGVAVQRRVRAGDE